MIEPIEKIVETKPQISAYVIIGKAGLWLSSSVLVFVIGCACVKLFVRQDGIDPSAVALASVIVQACQVVAIVAVSVLGWHGYKGEHLLHTLRHWNDVNPPEPKA